MEEALAAAEAAPAAVEEAPAAAEGAVVSPLEAAVEVDPDPRRAESEARSSSLGLPVLLRCFSEDFKFCSRRFF